MASLFHQALALALPPFSCLKGSFTFNHQLRSTAGAKLNSLQSRLHSHPTESTDRSLLLHGSFSQLRCRKSFNRVTHCRAKGSDPAHSSAEGDSEVVDPCNPLGLHALVWVGGWSHEECHHAISSTASLGYDLIEIPVLVPEEIDVEHTKRVLKDYGLACSTSLGLSFDRDVSSDEDVVAARGEQLLLDALNVASGIGATYLTGVTYSAIGKYPHGFPGGERTKKLAKILRHVASRASDNGVKFGLEIVNRYESNVLNTAEQGMALLEEIGHDNVCIHLDTYHMNIEEGSISKAIELCGDKLGYFHIGESHRGYLGSGNIDWNEVFRALARAGYKNPLTFESFSSSVVSQSLSDHLCVWRNLWEDSSDLACHAKSFIDAQWSAAKRTQLVNGKE